MDTNLHDSMQSQPFDAPGGRNFWTTLQTPRKQPRNKLKLQRVSVARLHVAIVGIERRTSIARRGVAQITHQELGR